jgi:hypothetical protein
VEKKRQVRLIHNGFERFRTDGLEVNLLVNILVYLADECSVRKHQNDNKWIIHVITTKHKEANSNIFDTFKSVLSLKGLVKDHVGVLVVTKKDTLEEILTLLTRNYHENTAIVCDDLYFV